MCGVPKTRARGQPICKSYSVTLSVVKEQFQPVSLIRFKASCSHLTYRHYTREFRMCIIRTMRCAAWNPALHACAPRPPPSRPVAASHARVPLPRSMLVSRGGRARCPHRAAAACRGALLGIPRALVAPSSRPRRALAAPSPRLALARASAHGHGCTGAPSCATLAVCNPLSKIHPLKFPQKRPFPNARSPRPNDLR